MGNKFSFLTLKIVAILFVVAYGAGLIALNYEDQLSEPIRTNLPLVFANMGLGMVLKWFTERRQARMSFVFNSIFSNELMVINL